MRPIRVKRADRGDVIHHRVVDEVAELVDESFDGVKPFHRQGRLAVRIDRIRHPADGEVLDVRRLGSQDGDDLVGDALHFERLDIMRRRQQVDVRRQLHRRVAPIARGENAEIAAVDEGLQLVAHRADVGDAVGLIVGQGRAELGGAGRIALERRDDVDPVERGKLIEMHDVVVDAVRRDNHVADILGVERHFEIERILHRAHRGDGVHRRADAADALREDPGIARVAVLEDELDAPPHLARTTMPWSLCRRRLRSRCAGAPRCG